MANRGLSSLVQHATVKEKQYNLETQKLKGRKRCTSLRKKNLTFLIITEGEEEETVKTDQNERKTDAPVQDWNVKDLEIF